MTPFEILCAVYVIGSLLFIFLAGLFTPEDDPAQAAHGALIWPLLIPYFLARVIRAAIIAALPQPKPVPPKGPGQ